MQTHRTSTFLCNMFSTDCKASRSELDLQPNAAESIRQNISERVLQPFVSFTARYTHATMWGTTHMCIYIYNISTRACEFEVPSYCGWKGYSMTQGHGSRGLVMATLHLRRRSGSRCRHDKIHAYIAMGPNPIPPVNIPIPTKMGSKMGGAPKTPKWYHGPLVLTRVNEPQLPIHHPRP